MRRARIAVFFRAVIVRSAWGLSWLLAALDDGVLALIGRTAVLRARVLVIALGVDDAARLDLLGLANTPITSTPTITTITTITGMHTMTTAMSITTMDMRSMTTAMLITPTTTTTTTTVMTTATMAPLRASPPCHSNPINLLV